MIRFRGVGPLAISADYRLSRTQRHPNANSPAIDYAKVAGSGTSVTVTLRPLTTSHRLRLEFQCDPVPAIFKHRTVGGSGVFQQPQSGDMKRLTDTFPLSPPNRP